MQTPTQASHRHRYTDTGRAGKRASTDAPYLNSDTGGTFINNHIQEVHLLTLLLVRLTARLGVVNITDTTL